MLATIWKLPVPEAPSGESSAMIKVPSGSRFLSFQMQEGDGKKIPMTWWLVDPKTKVKSAFLLKLVGTGWDSDPDLYYWEFMGTAQNNGMTFHLFSRPL